MTRGQVPLFPPDRRRSGPVERGWNRQLRALDREDRSRFPFLVELGRSAARLVDEAREDLDESRHTQSTTMRTAREIFEALLRLTHSDADTDTSLDELFSRLGDAAHVPPD